MDDRVLKVGDVVVFVDEHRVRHNALVTIWHGAKDGDTVGGYKQKYNATGIPCVNLLFVVPPDLNKTDPYGSQIERRSSVVHGKQQSPQFLGNYFCWPDEQ